MGLEGTAVNIAVNTASAGAEEVQGRVGSAAEGQALEKKRRAWEQMRRCTGDVPLPFFMWNVLCPCPPHFLALLPIFVHTGPLTSFHLVPLPDTNTPLLPGLANHLVSFEGRP